MPPVWPMTQLFGSVFGQDASTSNRGACFEPFLPSAAAVPASTSASAPAIMQT